MPAISPGKASTHEYARSDRLQPQLSASFVVILRCSSMMGSTELPEKEASISSKVRPEVCAGSVPSQGQEMEPYLRKNKVEVDGMDDTQAQKDQIILPSNRCGRRRFQVEPKNVGDKKATDGERCRLAAEMRREEFSHQSELIDIHGDGVPVHLSKNGLLPCRHTYTRT